MRSTLRIPWLCNFTRIGYETFIAPPFIHYVTVEVPFAPLMLLAKIRIDLLSCHLQEYNQNIQRYMSLFQFYKSFNVGILLQLLPAVPIPYKLFKSDFSI